MTRKEIVTALETHYNVKAKYMGVPSFNYTIEIKDKTYTIERDSKIKGPDGEEIEFESLMENGDGKEMERIMSEVHVSMEGHTGISLRNIINMIYSKEHLIKKVFEYDDNILNPELVQKINEENLKEEDELKSALEGIENPGVDFNFEEKNIIFKFCRNHEKNKAYIKFIEKLCEYAKSLKHASMKRSQTDNEKFAMRVWLIRLGFVGTDFKEIRKIILKDLSGNAAFRYLKKKEKVNNSLKAD
jgi:hypothetical protein